ncbi:hypothetical protein ACFXG4_12095 [Nocardia sp. NPDC059246]|uniref:hypothetical protein n=1 Tax=unclassified Nocardia TaxID=2637762 RepID=UPI00369D1374
MGRRECSPFGVVEATDNVAMPLPHARGRLDWSDLSVLVRWYRDPGVELPVGACGRIHLNDKRTAIRVDHRKYLAERVCRRSDCETSGTAVFRKNRGYTVKLPGELPRPTREMARASARLTRFSTALRQLIVDSAQREHDPAKLHGPAPDSIGQDSGCRCREFAALMETGRTDTLLAFGEAEIRTVLDHEHGGQAVGNNLRFLLYHVLDVYLRTNLIVAVGLEDRCQEWGSMTPDSRFRRQVLHDCDGLTFLPNARRFLENDVYMVDRRATEQLVEACFSYLAHYELLCRAVGRDADWTALIHPELGLAWSPASA